MGDEIARFEMAEKVGRAMGRLDDADVRGPDAYGSELRRHGCEYCLEAAQDDLVDGGEGAGFDRYDRPGSRYKNLAVCKDHAPMARAIVGLSRRSPGGHVSLAVQLPPLVRDLLGRRWHGHLDGGGGWLIVSFGVDGRPSGSTPLPDEALSGETEATGTLTRRLVPDAAAVLRADHGATEIVQFAIEHADFSSFYLALAYYAADPTYRWLSRNCLDPVFQAIQQLGGDVPDGASAADDTPAAFFDALKAAVDATGGTLDPRSGPPLSPPAYRRHGRVPASPAVSKLSIRRFELFERDLSAHGAVETRKLIRFSGPDLGSKAIVGREARIPMALTLRGSPGDRLTTLALDVMAGSAVLASASLTAEASRDMARPFDGTGTLDLGRSSGQLFAFWSIKVADLRKLCRQGHLVVTLRLRVVTAQGQQASRGWRPCYITLCLEAAISAIVPAAGAFRDATMKDARIREQYGIEAKKASDQILAVVKRHDFWAADTEAFLRYSAETANGIRNGLMDNARAGSSAISRMGAVLKKKEGLTLDQVLDKKAKARFGKSATFAALDQEQRKDLYVRTIKSAGKSNRLINVLVLSGYPAVARGFILITVGVALYHIQNAEDQVAATLEEVFTIGGSIAGAAALPAAYGFVFGGPPGAFVAEGLFFSGCIMGALLGEYGFSLEEEQRAIVEDWLGHRPPRPTPMPAPAPVLSRVRTGARRLEIGAAEPETGEGDADQSAPQALKPIKAVSLVPSGSTVHVVEDCPVLRDPRVEASTTRIAATTDLDRIAERFERPICGTCLRMLGFASRRLFLSEGPRHGLEIRTDAVIFSTAPGLLSAGRQLVIDREDVVGVEAKGPDWWHRLPLLTVFYAAASVLPAGDRNGAGQLDVTFDDAESRDDAQAVIAGFLPDEAG